MIRAALPARAVRVGGTAASLGSSSRAAMNSTLSLRRHGTRRVDDGIALRAISDQAPSTPSGAKKNDNRKESTADAAERTPSLHDYDNEQYDAQLHDQGGALRDGEPREKGAVLMHSRVLVREHHERGHPVDESTQRARLMANTCPPMKRNVENVTKWLHVLFAKRTEREGNDVSKQL